MVVELTEWIISLSEARRLVAQQAGKPISPATIWRWATIGVRGVRLETALQGGRPVTSAEAVQRFFCALNDRPPPAHPNRTKRDDEVEAELSRRGI